ncbi:hypothetical protein KFU94_44295 [Chloroflexi bacterium TSY]|nr:hypothetical protein [Chloroflexi bacterium TSY]
MNEQQGPLEESASEWFVNRKEELDRYWKWATRFPNRIKGSEALIGLRRTGKTAILHKLFNRLFYEQNRMMPIYISFARYVNRPEPIGAYEFAKEYFTGFIRSYLAFRYRQPDLLNNNIQYEQLRDFSEKIKDELALEWFRVYELELSSTQNTRAHSIMQWVINFPKGYAWNHDIPMVIIIDEFQVLTSVYNPDSKRMRNLTDSFQEASETKWAPLLVSGSSVSMMVDDALGGMLSGRFHPLHLEPLSQEHALDMIVRLGGYNGVEMTEEFALEIWELTEGYPYPIECIMNSRSAAATAFPDGDALEEVLLYELTQTRGALWSHYHKEYGKYISQINGDQIARKVLLWIIKHPKRRIFADAIAADLNLQEQKVRESLEQLQAADIIHSTGWYSYEEPADPMLRRYIEYQHKREVEQLAPELAIEDLVGEVRRIRGETSHKIGQMAESILAGVMRSFDDRDVDGETYFGQPGTIRLPKMATIEQRTGVIKQGEISEIDVIGEPKLVRLKGTVADEPIDPDSDSVWLVSVRYRQQKMGEQAVTQFLKHAETVQAEKGYTTVTRWYFSKSGFTEEATALLQAEGVYFSNLEQFNTLANQFDFLGLP